MGEPVKIVELAEKMIRLSGYEPNVDIQIKFTGLRPGEKLYEELLIDEDNLKKTDKDRIFVVQQTGVDFIKIQEAVQKLIEEAYDETQDIRSYIKELVPEYAPQGIVEE